MKVKISFVSPVYNSEKIILKLIDEIHKVMLLINESYEIILVDDRSQDNSWDVMKEISHSNNNVKSIRLSKNFGQHPAIMAGLSMVEGDWVVVLDCDLQDQPKEVIKLYNKAVEGYDIVLAKRNRRRDSYIKKKMSQFFSRVYSYLTNSNFDGSVANFGIYKFNVIKEVLNMNDYIKSFSLFVRWLGFNKTEVFVEHGMRYEGKSTYNMSKLISLAFNTIISFSNKPLKIFVKFGLLIAIISLFFGLFTIYRYLSNQIQVIGYSSLIVSIWFLSGIIISTIGIVGIYIGKIFDQSKNRPSFIIDKIINGKDS